MSFNQAKCRTITPTSSLLGASFDHTTISTSVERCCRRLNTLSESPSPQHVVPLARHCLSGATYSARLGDPVSLVSTSLERLLSHLSSLTALYPNASLSTTQMMLASLPLARGGLGLPDPGITAPHLRSDCLAATFPSSSTIVHHLTQPLDLARSTHIVSALALTAQHALAVSGSLTGPPRVRVPPPSRTAPLTGTTTHQRPSTSRHALHQRRIDHTLSMIVDKDPTLAAQIPININTDPFFLASCTQTLTRAGFAIAMRTRLNIPEPSVSATCPKCNTHFLNLTPLHLATCMHQATTRHNTIRDLIATSMTIKFGSSHVRVEPPGLVPSTDARPADILLAPCTLDPLNHTAFDVTVSTEDLATARHKKLITQNAAYLRTQHIMVVPLVFSPLALTEFHTTKALQSVASCPRGPGGILHDIFISLLNTLAAQYDERNVMANILNYIHTNAAAAAAPPILPPGDHTSPSPSLAAAAAASPAPTTNTSPTISHNTHTHSQTPSSSAPTTFAEDDAENAF